MANTNTFYNNPKWDSPEELQFNIDNYFDKCEENKAVPTITGLALHLDSFVETLFSYEQDMETYVNDDSKMEFMEDKIKRFRYESGKVIKRAKQRIAEHVIAKGFEMKNPVFAIFYLKAALGYRDADTPDQSNMQLPKLVINILPAQNQPILLDKTQYVVDGNKNSTIKQIEANNKSGSNKGRKPIVNYFKKKS